MRGYILPVSLGNVVSKNCARIVLLLLVIFTGVINVLFAQSSEEIRNQIRIAEGKDLDSLYFQYFLAFVDEDLNITDYDSALQYASLSNQYSLQNGDSVLIMRTEYVLGYIYKNRLNFNKAIPRFFQAMKIAERNPDMPHSTATYARSLNGLGLTYYYSGRLNDALTYLLMSLEEKEKEGDPYDISVAQNNLGLVFYQMSVYDRARRYFEDAMANRLNSEYPDEIGEILVNIGLSYVGSAESVPEVGFKNDDLKKGKEYFLRAIQLCQETETCKEYIIYEAYNGLGLIYMESDKADSSFLMLDKAMELALDYSQSYNAIKSLINLSILKRSEGNYQEALQYSHEALSLAGSQLTDDQPNDGVNVVGANTNLIQLKEVHQELSFIHKELGRLDSAYYHLERYNEYKDQVFSTSISSTLENWASNIISEQDNTISEQDNTIEESRRRNTIITVASTSVILLTSLFALILYRSNNLRKKANNKLLEANMTIEEKNNELQNVNLILEDKVRERTKELKLSNEALKQSNQELDNFIYKTSHDIRGPLATLQGICNVALLDVQDPKAVDYLSKLNNTATNLNEILSKLLIINQINNSEISKTPLKIKEIVHQLVLENAQKINEKHIDARVNIEEDIEIRSDEDLLRIIIGNLLNNAFKYYKRSYSVNSFVEIRAKKNNINLQIEVIDNGIGIDDNAQSKVFEIFSKATEMSDSAGLGLYLAKLSVEKLSGKIALEKTKEGFTKFKVTFPINV